MDIHEIIGRLKEAASDGDDKFEVMKLDDYPDIKEMHEMYVKGQEVLRESVKHVESEIEDNKIRFFERLNELLVKRNIVTEKMIDLADGQLIRDGIVYLVKH